MITSTRVIDLPPNARTEGLVLRYGFQRGLVITYRSFMTVTVRVGQEPRAPQITRSLLSLKVIGIDETDGGARLVVHHVPIDEGSPSTIVYVKTTEFGESIESTDPSGGVNLVLPRMAVQAGDTWREIETFHDPHAFAPVKVARLYQVESIWDDQVTIGYTADATTFEVGPGLQQVRTGSGTFGFDATYGVLTSQDVRWQYAVESGDTRVTVDAVHTLVLADA